MLRSTCAAAKNTRIRLLTAPIAPPDRSSHAAAPLSTTAAMVHPVSDSHPYFPLDLHLPDYVPLQVGFDYILGVFAVAVITVFASTWRLSGEGGRRRVGGGWGGLARSYRSACSRGCLTLLAGLGTEQNLQLG